ncbi:MAG: hypothetical protein ACFFCW_25380 [Candidatus Hodarchaeota archaeon]
MVNRCQMFFLFILILFLCQVISGCCPPFCPQPKEKPVAILNNSRGQKVAEFTILDAVFGSFSGLLPDTWYEIQVVRSDGKEVSYSSFTSDKRGIIPTAALWWDVGVEYPKSRVGKLNLRTLFQYTYSCLIKRDKRMIFEIPLRLQPLEETGPIIYSSNMNGDPLNGFMHGKESVYLTGRNLPPGCKLHIYVVEDRYTWEFGDRLDTVQDTALFLQLHEGQREFTTSIWSSDLTEIGSYDLIVEYVAQNGVFDHVDLTDNVYGVGFTVFAPLPSPGPQAMHIETDVACQAPPQDSTGTIVGAPNPIYKDLFAPIEEVWVAVNPYAGSGNYVGKTARLYVVNHMVKTDWFDGTALTDVSVDGYETTTIQPGCANVNYNRVWTNPTIREDGYDVVVDFAPFGVYNKGLDIIDKLDDKGFIVPTLWVCLESVSLNHNSISSASDALNIRKNYTQAVVIPEWQKAKKSHPAAYIKNRNVTVKAVFSAAAGVNSAQIRATVRYGSLGSVNQKTVSFSGGASGQVSFQVAAPTPNEVKYFYQSWKWYCENVNGSGSSEVHLSDSRNKIYVVLASPLAPMAEPWIDGILERACWWASGENNEVNAGAELTDNAYAYTGKTYNGYGSHAYGTTFDLTTFLQESWADCQDMSAYLHTLCRALGISPAQMLRIDGGFHTKPILAIGNTTWSATSWNFHRVGYYNNKVYDACLMLNQSAPIVPKNMDVNGNYKAGLYDYGTWSPGTPYDITTIY